MAFKVLLASGLLSWSMIEGPSLNAILAVTARVAGVACGVGFGTEMMTVV